MNWKTLQDEMRRTSVPCPVCGTTGILYNTLRCLASVAQEEHCRMHGNFSDPGSAVGLAATQLLAFCNTNELDAEAGRGVWPAADNHYKNRNKLLLAIQTLGSLAGGVAWRERPSEITVGQILYHLDAWCIERNLSLFDLAWEAYAILEATRVANGASVWLK